MDQKALVNLRSRADAKLSYAEIHLEELRVRGHHGGKGGDVFARSHQESFLYHLLGAKEAFVLELNVYSGCNLPQDQVTLGKLKNQLQQQEKQSLELAELYKLESDPTGWLYRAKKMRDHSTHVGGIPRGYHHGGPNPGEVWLINPGSASDSGKHFIDEFQEWHKNMKELLEQLRKAAIQANRSNISPPS